MIRTFFAEKTEKRRDFTVKTGFLAYCKPLQNFFARVCRHFFSFWHCCSGRFGNQIGQVGFEGAVFVEADFFMQPVADAFDASC